MSALPFTLAGERKTCPICERPNVRLASSGLEIVREYRCGDCGARWAVEGRQEPLAGGRMSPYENAVSITDKSGKALHRYEVAFVLNGTLAWGALVTAGDCRDAARQVKRRHHGSVDVLGVWAA